MGIFVPAAAVLFHPLHKFLLFNIIIMKEEVFYAYVERVCRRFKITNEQLFKKDKRFAKPRQFLIYLCYKKDIQSKYISEYFRDNGYKIYNGEIYYGIKTITGMCETDFYYRELLNKLTFKTQKSIRIMLQ
jgi:hypothetical protein